jgi:glucosamine 6-phosphate synthetase-like amidotransferase/phosphosugar isomerase protein
MLNVDFYEDILSQHDSQSLVSELLDKVGNLKVGDPPNRIFITGNGDSYIVGLTMETLSRIFHHDNVYVRSPSDVAYVEEFNDGDVLIALSMSGNSNTLLLAAKKIQALGGICIAITNNLAGKVPIEASAVLEITRISKNRKTPHASDYLNSLFATGILLNRLTDKNYLDSKAVVEYIQTNLLGIGKQIFKQLNIFSGAKRFVICFADINLSTAIYGSAKFWEAQGTFSIPSNLDELGHGLHMTLSQEDVIIMLPTYNFPKDRVLRICNGLEKNHLKYLLFSDKKEDFKDVLSVEIPSIETKCYPFVHHIILQWIVFYFSEANDIDVTTGKGKDKNINFDEFNTYLR